VTRSSRRWVIPSISYSPLPPMMPITGSVMSASRQERQWALERRVRRGTAGQHTTAEHAPSAHPLDPHIHQPAPQAVRPPKEDTQIVVAHPVEETGLAIPLTQHHHRKCLPHDTLLEGEKLLLAELPQNAVAAGLGLGGNLVGHSRRLRAGTAGIGEDVEVADGELVKEMAGIFERRLGLTGKADDHIDPDGDPRHRLVEGLHHLAEVPRSITAGHPSEDLVVATLQGQVDIATEAGRSAEEANHLQLH